MCKYPVRYQILRNLSHVYQQGPSSSCSTKTIFRELSSAAKDAILAKHNELRRRVAKGEETGGINSPQPGASNMRKLVRTTPCNNTAVSFPAPGLERGAGGHRSEVGRGRRAGRDGERRPELVQRGSRLSCSD